MPRHTSYREIAEDLAERIHIGEYAPGEKLPTYEELAKLYSVSRATAQRAITTLRDRGVVRGHQGVGVFVPDQPAS